MDWSFLFIALGAISVVTSLTVEGVKKIFDERQIKYSANILAVIVSITLTIVGSICYVIYTETPITAQVIIEMIVLAFLSFLMATTSYDKLIQAIKQLQTM